MIRRCAFLALLSVFIALPAFAAEKVDFLAGPKLSYGDQLNAGITFGLHVQNADLTILADVSAVRIDGIHGTTDFSVGCRDYRVPVNVEGRTRGVVGVTVLFKLRKPR